MIEYEWRYMPGASVRHAMIAETVFITACGIADIPKAMWHGTGSQDEYDKVERLRDCLLCNRAGYYY